MFSLPTRGVSLLMTLSIVIGSVIPIAFAGVPSQTGNGSSSTNPAIVVSGLSQSGLSGLKDLKFWDLFSGGSTYSLPMNFPSGPRGINPGLTLTYSSNGKDGLTPYGFGWSLGISEITRSSRMGIDKMYSLDEYLVDGTEFVSASGAYYARIASDNTKLETTGSGGFIVTSPDGTKKYYGNMSDSRVADPSDARRISSWGLEKVELPTWEKMLYRYERDTGARYVTSISWAFSDSSIPLYEVKFSYIPKPHSIESYRTGFAVKTQRLLSEVSLFVSNEKKRSYQIEYDSAETVNSHLVQITEKSGDLSMPATQFEYGTAKFANLLTKISLPHEAEVVLTYNSSALLKRQNGTVANPQLPLNLMVLTSVQVKEPVAETQYTTNYLYEDGYFYTDLADPFRREYAGFGKVTTTQNAGEKDITYFYQGRRDRDGDSITKKGRPYLIQKFAANGNLVTQQRSAYSEITDGTNRKYLFLDKQIFTEFGGGKSLSTAKTFEYNGYGNLTREKDYGEVVSSQTGSTFADSGSDLLTTEYQYSQNNSQYLFGFPNDKKILSITGAILYHERSYYDSATLGSVGNYGLPTAKETEELETGRYIRNEFTYTDDHTLTKSRDPLGNETFFSYDPYRIYLASTTSPLWLVEREERDYVTGQVTKRTSSQGVATVINYDGFGRQTSTKLISRTGEEALIQAISYNNSSFPHSYKTIQYGAAGNRESTIYLDGLGRWIQSRSTGFANGDYSVSDMEYDYRDLPVFASYPYAASGSAFAIASDKFSGTLTTYDTLGRTYTQTDSRWTAYIGYTPQSATITDRRGFVKNMDYDTRGNLESMSYIDGSGSRITTRYEYTPLGQLNKFIDPVWNTRTLTYNSLGQLKTLSDLIPSWAVLDKKKQFTYNDLGQMTEELDLAGNSTKYFYDAMGRPTLQSYYRTDGTKERENVFTYDIAENGSGALASQSNASYSRTYSYNSFGQRIGETSSITAGTLTRSYSQSQVLAPTGETLRTTYPDGYEVNYSYQNGFLQSASGHLPGETDTLLSTVLAIAPDGKVSKQQVGNGIQTEKVFDSNFWYRISNQKTTLANGSLIQDLRYGYDSEDNITSLDEYAEIASKRKVQYGYDSIGRLVQANYQDLFGAPITSESYAYDVLGNVTSGPLGTYTYGGTATNTNPHAVTAAGPLAINYDSRGNMSKMTNSAIGPTATKNFNYDVAGRLIKVTDDTGGLDFSYSYDAANIRLSKRDFEENSTTFYPSDLYEESIDRDPANSTTGMPATTRTTIDRYVYMGWEKLATIEFVDVVERTASTPSGSGADTTESGTESTGNGSTSGSGTTTESGSGSTSSGSTDSGSTSSGTTSSGTVTSAPVSFPLHETRLIYHFTDHLASATLDTDANGNILSLRDYLPYGEARIDFSGAQVGNVGNTGVKPYKNRYSFGGKELDAESHLQYFEARYYSNPLGRFTSQDPVFWELGRSKRASNFLSDPEQLNSYSYARNNPVRFTDPTGEEILVIFRSLNIKSDWGYLSPGRGAVHSYIYIDGTANWWKMELIPFTIGWYQNSEGKLVLEKNAQADASRKQDKGVWKIDPAAYGMSEEELRNKIMDSYNKNKGIDQDYDKYHNNCNNVTTTILNDAGVSLKDIKEKDPSWLNPWLWERLKNNYYDGLRKLNDLMKTKEQRKQEKKKETQAA